MPGYEPFLLCDFHVHTQWSDGTLTVRADDLQAYLDGVRRVLHDLGMLGEAPPALHRPVRVRLTIIRLRRSANT